MHYFVWQSFVESPFRTHASTFEITLHWMEGQLFQRLQVLSFYIFIWKSGPVAGALARKIGSRYLVVFGGTLYGLGLILASTANSVLLLGVSLVVLAGKSMPLHVWICNWFHLSSFASFLWLILPIQVSLTGGEKIGDYSAKIMVWRGWTTLQQKYFILTVSLETLPNTISNRQKKGSWGTCLMYVNKKWSALVPFFHWRSALAHPLIL